MVRPDPYAVGLDNNPVNFVPLTPLHFLARTAEVYAEWAAVIYGDRRYTWS